VIDGRRANHFCLSESRQVLSQLIFFFRFSEIYDCLRASRARSRGAFRDRHERWVRDAMDAMTRVDEACRCGRPSRMVLAPRRWRQVLRVGDVGPSVRHAAQGDGDYQARHPGESTEQPLTPLRREGRMMRRTCGDYSCAFFTAHEAAGAVVAPGFPCALHGERGHINNAKPGQIVPREGGVASTALAWPILRDAACGRSPG
jgi:hypothetical protein